MKKSQLFKRGVLASTLLLFLVSFTACNNSNAHNPAVNSVNSQSEKSLILNTNESSKKNSDIKSDISLSDEEIINYMKENSSILDVKDNDDFSSLSIIDDDIKDKEIFFTGETHGIGMNYKTQLKFIKYLHKNADIRYILCEMPISSVLLLDNYLQTGDNSYLEKYMETFKHYPIYNNEVYEMWKSVYEYNSHLPENEKLHALGIDIEFTGINTLEGMISLLPDSTPPKKISSDLKILKETYENLSNPEKEASSEDEKKLIQFLNDFKEDINLNRNEYKSYLKDNLMHFELMLDNILYTSEHMEEIQSNVPFYRDKRMYDNFKTLYEHLPQGKYYGQLGGYHVYQNQGKYNQPRIAAMLNEEDATFKDKVLTIQYIYKNCKYLDKGFKDNSRFSSSPYSPLLSDLFEDNLRLIKLTGETSPFNHNIISLIDDQYEEYFGCALDEGVTTDYYQYIVLFNRTEAPDAYKENIN